MKFLDLTVTQAKGWSEISPECRMFFIYFGAMMGLAVADHSVSAVIQILVAVVLFISGIGVTILSRRSSGSVAIMIKFRRRRAMTLHEILFFSRNNYWKSRLFQLVQTQKVLRSNGAKLTFRVKIFWLMPDWE